MAKQEKSTAVENEVSTTVVEKEVSVKKNNSSYMSKEDLLKNLKGAETIIELTSEYLTFDEDDMGNERRFIFLSMTEMTSVDGDSKVPAAKLLGEDGKMYTTAAAVIVGSVSELGRNTPISITFTGKEKGKNGKYDKFKINLLSF